MPAELQKLHSQNNQKLIFMHCTSFCRAFFFIRVPSVFICGHSCQKNYSKYFKVVATTGSLSAQTRSFYSLRCPASPPSVSPAGWRLKYNDSNLNNMKYYQTYLNLYYKNVKMQHKSQHTIHHRQKER